MGPVPGVRFNIGLPDFAVRHKLPDELPEPILITAEEAQEKLRELGVNSFYLSLVSKLIFFLF